jgi:hypothetical protein
MEHSARSRLEQVLAPVADLQVEVVDGECLVFHPEHEQVMYLNPAAALVWGLCDGVRPVREICRMIREGYPDAPADLEEDVMGALTQLEEYRVLVAV